MKSFRSPQMFATVSLVAIAMLHEGIVGAYFERSRFSLVRYESNINIHTFCNLFFSLILDSESFVIKNHIRASPQISTTSRFVTNSLLRMMPEEVSQVKLMVQLLQWIAFCCR